MWKSHKYKSMITNFNKFYVKKKSHSIIKEQNRGPNLVWRVIRSGRRRKWQAKHTFLVSPQWLTRVLFAETEQWMKAWFRWAKGGWRNHGFDFTTSGVRGIYVNSPHNDKHKDTRNLWKEWVSLQKIWKTELGNESTFTQLEARTLPAHSFLSHWQHRQMAAAVTPVPSPLTFARWCRSVGDLY